MNKITLSLGFVLAVFLFTDLPSVAHAAITGGGSDDSYRGTVVVSNSDERFVLDSETDAAGNLYVVGNTTDGAYLAKYTPDGFPVWTKNLSSTIKVTVYALAFDNSGDFYITGGYVGTADFDPGPGVDERTNDNPDFPPGSNSYDNKDIFVSKYSADGVMLWTQTVSAPNEEEFANDITVLGGRVYVVGYTNYPIDFDPGPGVDTQGTIYTNGFITTYDLSGNYQWTVTTEAGYATFNSVATIGDSVVVGGAYYQGSLDLSPGADTMIISGSGDQNSFIASYSGTNGSLEWGHAIAPTTDFFNRLPVVADDQSVYIGGDFMNEVDFDPSESEDVRTPAGYMDAFVNKYSANGTYQWTRTFDNNDVDRIRGLDVDGASNKLYLTGEYRGTIDFDPGSGVDEHTSTVLGPTARGDTFLVALDTDGDFVFAKSFTGEQSEYPNDVTIGSDGTLYALINFEGTVDFDPGDDLDERTSLGARDGAIVSFNNGGMTTTEPDPECSDGQDNDGDGLVDGDDHGCHSDFDPSDWYSYDGSLNDEGAHPDVSFEVTNVSETTEKIYFLATADPSAVSGQYMYGWDWNSDGIFDELSTHRAGSFGYEGECIESDERVINLYLLDLSARTVLAHYQEAVPVEVNFVTNWFNCLSGDDPEVNIELINQRILDKDNNGEIDPEFAAADKWWWEYWDEYDWLTPYEMKVILSKKLLTESDSDVSFGNTIETAITDEMLVDEVSAQLAGSNPNALAKRYAQNVLGIDGFGSDIPASDDILDSLGETLSNPIWDGYNVGRAAEVAVNASYVVKGLDAIGKIKTILTLSEALDAATSDKFNRALAIYLNGYIGVTAGDWQALLQSLVDEMDDISDIEKTTIKNQLESRILTLGEYYGPHIEAPTVGTRVLNADFKEDLRQNYEMLTAAAVQTYTVPARSSVGVLSPVELCGQIADGRRTGLCDGVVLNEIPNTIYDEENEKIHILGPLTGITFGLTGLADDEYGVVADTTEGGTEHSFYMDGFPVETDSVHTWQFEEGESGKLISEVSVDVDADGTNETTLQVPDEFTDTVAPTTTVSLVGDQLDDRTYYGAVNLSLAATDGEEGSGVKKTEYSLDGVNWVVYDAPLTLVEEKEFIIYYRSTDWFENIEVTKSITFEIVSAQGLIGEVVQWSEESGLQKLIQVLAGSLDEKFWTDQNSLKGAGKQSVLVRLDNAIRFAKAESAYYADRLSLAKQILGDW